jgi:DNA polymerase-3 subunit delta
MSFQCDFLELDETLGKSPPLPVYLVHGEEPFLRERAVQRILERLAPAPEMDHALSRYDGEGDEKTSLSAVVTDLCTPSLFSPVKIALVRRAGPALEAEGEALIGFPGEAPDGSHLLLEAPKVDMRRKWARAVKKGGGLVSCPKLYDQPPPWSEAPRWENPLARWTEREARSHGLVLDPRAAQHLIDRVGASLRGLFEEIEKLALYLRASPEHPVEVSDRRIDDVVGEYNEFGLFKLTDAVGARDLAAALRIAGALFTQGLHRPGRSGVVHDAGAIATLCTERIYAKIREIYRARGVLDRGGGVEGLVKELGKHKAFAPKLARECRGFSPDEAGELLRALVACDLGIKTGRGRPRMLLETLIGKIAGSRG